MISYKVIQTKHNGREDRNFKLIRPHGTDDYLFLHFKTPVIFTLFDKIHHIFPGTCILLSPGTPHEFYPNDCELVHDWMHFMMSDESEFMKLNIKINTFFTPVDPNFITTSVKRCELELIYRDELYEDLISSEVTGMFIRLKRQLNGSAPGHHTEVLKALRYDIYHDPSRYLSTVDMAMSVNLSRSRFTVVYKELFGVTPKNDHINAKISKALYLLSVGTHSLTEISEMCGYQNIYHFIRQFQSVTGITPGAYRKNY